MRDRVLLAFTSDHGTEFLDHGQHFHGHTVYGELNRVPMFFWGPVVRAGRRAHPDARCRTSTSCRRCSISPGSRCRKRRRARACGPGSTPKARSPAAAAKGWRRAPAITEKAYVAAREPGGYASYSIVSEGWKLIHNVYEPAAGAAAASQRPWRRHRAAAGGRALRVGRPVADRCRRHLPPPAEYELFDHAKDPLNLTNVAADHPDQVKELAEQLERWREKAQSQRLKSDADMAAQASPEELERLRALGYL